MRVHYYAHVIYNNPGIYDYEYIIDNHNVKEFSEEILRALENNYNEIDGSEELNCIDIGGWEDFIEENKIEYNEGDSFPYGAVWKCIKLNTQRAIDSSLKNNEKYNAIEEAVQNYSWLLECADLAYGDYVFSVRIFENSRDFAEHFFQYLKESIDYKQYIKPFKKRIDSIGYLIEERNFPNSDFHEGILSEWINIYKLVYED